MAAAAVVAEVAGAAGARVIVGGLGAEEFAYSGAPNVKGSILQVDGVLYVTAPDNVWALDARDGHELWRYFWKTRGGTHIGNRGAGMWHNYLFFETPDDVLVSLDARTGKERWNVPIANFAEEYFSTVAPVVVGNHVLVGTGNDIDAPGFLQSFDPETGALQWKLYTVPMKPGDPGLETWPSLEAARHGGAQTWIPGSYDPETKLYILGTGNPTPGYTGQGRQGRQPVHVLDHRGERRDREDGLVLPDLAARHARLGLGADAGPDRRHDRRQAAQARRDGVPQRLVLHARSRHRRAGGLGEVRDDRELGEGDAEKRRARSGSRQGSDHSRIARVSHGGGVVNWPPPAFSPDTGLFYVHENNGFNLVYLTDPDPRGSMGLAGKAVGQVGAWPSALRAIDYKTGKPVWRHEFPGGGGGVGILATAGKLVFTSDGGGNLVAFDATNGNPLWHTHIGGLSNAPQTYSVDGKQYLLVAVGDTLIRSRFIDPAVFVTSLAHM